MVAAAVIIRLCNTCVGMTREVREGKVEQIYYLNLSLICRFIIAVTMFSFS